MQRFYTSFEELQQVERMFSVVNNFDASQGDLGMGRLGLGGFLCGCQEWYGVENDLWMKSLQLRVQFEIVAPLVCKLTMQMTIMTESSNGSLLDAELYSLLSNISL
jgi:hypothetical protein